MESDSDEGLVARAQGGTVEALDLLVRRHQSWVFNLALRMVWRREAAEDATQEILARSPFDRNWICRRELSQAGGRTVYGTAARHRPAVESHPS